MFNDFILLGLRVYYTPNQNLARFVLYFKIINTFVNIIMVYTFYSKLSKELKN